MLTYLITDMKGGETMCCGTESQHGEFCGCGVPSEYTPRFMTADQRIAKLEQYLAGLQEEAKAVREHIAKIKKEK
jgi:hypothetical protein